MEIGWAEYGSKVTEIQGKVSESRVASQYLSWEQWLGVADSWRASGRVPAIVTGVPGSGGVRGLGGGQGAGGHGTAGAQNPVPLGAGAEGGDGESGSRGTVWHKSQRGTGRERDTTHPYLGTRGGEVWQGREWQSPGAGLERGSGARPGPGARPMGQGCSDRGCGAPGRVHAEVLGEAGVRRRCLGHERLVGRRRAIPAWVGRLGEPRGRGRGGRARLGHGHHAAPRGHRRRHRCLLHLLPGLGGGSGSDAVLDPRRGRCSPEGPSPSPR